MINRRVCGIQEMRTGTELQLLQSDVDAVLSEGHNVIQLSPVGIDTSDIEVSVESVGKLLTDINQQVLHTLQQSREIHTDSLL